MKFRDLKSERVQRKNINISISYLQRKYFGLKKLKNYSLDMMYDRFLYTTFFDLQKPPVQSFFKDLVQELHKNNIAIFNQNELWSVQSSVVSIICEYRLIIILSKSRKQDETSKHFKIDTDRKFPDNFDPVSFIFNSIVKAYNAKYPNKK